MPDSSNPGPQSLRDWIERAARRDPAKPFIHSIEDRKTLSYAELGELTRRIAAYLHRQNLAANDRVVLLADNSIEHLALYIGVMAYGATICTIHTEMNRWHLERIVPALRPRLVVYEPQLGIDELVGAVDAPRVPLGRWAAVGSDGFYGLVAGCGAADGRVTAAGAGHDAAICFTSGTSARPKGVVLTFCELLSNVEPIGDMFGLGADDRIYDFRSYNWASAQLLSALGPLAKGATLVMGRKFTRSRFFDNIKQYGATIAAGNPTTISMLLNGGDVVRAGDVPTLRFITSSSAPLLPEEWRRFEERFGIRVTQGYGSSETGWIAANPGETRRFGTVGRPLAYHRLTVTDSNGQPLAPGETGHIELGGVPDRAYRYLADDGSIRVHCRGRIRTGDLGFLDADGYLHVTGRAKDLIIRGGVNIAPLEIESVMTRLPEIVEAAAVGVPDRIYGEEIVGYVVLRPDARLSPADVLKHCRAALPAFKVPKTIVVRDRLPKTERGKLDRKALVEEWVRQSTAAAMSR